MSAITREEQQRLQKLLTTSRWVALATVGRDGPLASQVMVAGASHPGYFLMHLSELAEHTRNLLSDPRASLLFAEPDAVPGQDPQSLARVSLRGRADRLSPDQADYPLERACFLAAVPGAAQQFTLGDFHMFRFEVAEARYVSGYGRVHRLAGKDIAQVLVRNETDSRG